jgi:hypothetical protein
MPVVSQACSSARRLTWCTLSRNQSLFDIAGIVRVPLRGAIQELAICLNAGAFLVTYYDYPSKFRCATHCGSGSSFPPLPSEGAKSRAFPTSRITWAAVNAKKPESNRTRTQEPILSGPPRLSPINRGTTDSCRCSAKSRRSSDFRADASSKRAWKSMPCRRATGCISWTNSRTAAPKERL